MAVMTVHCSAQQVLVPLFEIKEQADFIVTDNLLNTYIIRGTEMIKYNKTGDFQFRYSDKRLGNIEAVDVTFPLRPLLNYPAINYVVLLDNTLSNNRGNVNLLHQGINLGILACSSVQNHFWFYDAMEFQLVRTNENFRTVSVTGNLAQVLRLANLEPTYMVEFANRLYVNNPSTGILVFDIFGTYMRTIPLHIVKRFQVHESELVFHENGVLKRYNFQSDQYQEIPLPEGSTNAELQKNRVWVQYAEKVVVYTLN